jgi:type II secretory pathway pseudopilin PulG
MIRTRFLKRPRLVEDEGGWALLTALLLMVVMLIGGLSLLRAVDTQTDSSKVERRRETAFNLAEGAMNAQMFALSRDWPGPGMASNPYPAWCTPSVDVSRCPSSPALTSAFANVDAAGASWTTTVRDDGASPLTTYYDDATIASQPNYDANDNGRVWVRAQATAKGKTRTLVALVRLQLQEEDAIHAAVAAGRLVLTNNGSKPIIDGGGPVVVRCAPATGESTACLGQPVGQGGIKNTADLMSFLQTQIPGTTPAWNTSLPPAMSAAALARLKQTAIGDGTYYATCPPDAKLTGAVVWIENGNCAPGGGMINSPGNPGMLIINRGSIDFEAQTDFYGIIYSPNADNRTDAIVKVHADGVVHGGVLVDGWGIVEVGSNKSNIVYDPNAFKAVRSYGSAGVIQNTWREIKGTIGPTG